MRKLTLISFFLMASIPFLLSFPGWDRHSQPAPGQRLQGVLVHPEGSSRLFASSDSEIFEGGSRAEWKSIWRMPYSRHKIHRLTGLQAYPETVFALTERGLFRGELPGRRFQTVFKGANPSEQSVLSLASNPSNPKHLLLGTGGGLFESTDGGKNWRRLDFFSKDPVSVLYFHNHFLFVGSEAFLFRSHDRDNFEIVFALPSFATSGERESRELTEESAEGRAAEPLVLLTQIVRDENGSLWLGTADGVWYSRNEGVYWQPVSQSGMRNTHVTDLVYDAQTHLLAAATLDGVYRFAPHEERWHELFEGLSDTQIRGLGVLKNAEGRVLVAASGEGLMQYVIPAVAPAKPEVTFFEMDLARLFRKMIQLEPTARDVHEAVIRYDNLSNSKINRWHKESRLRALLPDFSFGKSFSRSNSIDLDRGSTNTSDVYITGPDEIDKNWDADVSWDLGDFIWGSSQTSIDSREKLMVELRHEHLAQATRVYYERRRLQMEIVFSPSPTDQEHFQRLIRMDELTALLDGMTGGFFSEKLYEIHRAHPEIADLWSHALVSRSNLNWPQAA